MIDWYNDLFLGKCRQMFYWNPSYGWKVCLGLLGSLSFTPSYRPSFCPSFLHPSVLSSVFSEVYVFLEFTHYLFVIFGMRLGLPLVVVVEFLQKNLVWAKMTKKLSKIALKWYFSTIFKNFGIHFCLKH